MIGFASNPSWQVIFVPADVTMKIRIIMKAIRTDRLGFVSHTTLYLTLQVGDVSLPTLANSAGK